MNNRIIGILAVCLATVVVLVFAIRAPNIELSEQDREMATQISEETGIPVNVVLVGLLAAKTDALTGAEGTMASNPNYAEAVRVCFGEFHPTWRVFNACAGYAGQGGYCVAVKWGDSATYYYIPCESQ